MQRVSKDLRDSLKVESPTSKLLKEFVDKLKTERVGKK